MIVQKGRQVERSRSLFLLELLSFDLPQGDILSRFHTARQRDIDDFFLTAIIPEKENYSIEIRALNRYIRKRESTVELAKKPAVGKGR